MRRITRTGLLVAIGAFTLSCSLFAPHNDPIEISIVGDAFTLTWDPPVGTHASSLRHVESYELFHQEYPGPFFQSWQQLSSVPAADSLEFRVTNEQLTPGTYVFAVRAVYADGSASSYHSSTESAADPPTGWYLRWIGE